MKKFEVTILGSLAALPHHGLITSLQVVQYEDFGIIVDCGEGGQMLLAKYKLHRLKIRIICISHLHGDHVFGLPGLLSSFQHHQRKLPLTILGPPGIRTYLETIIQYSQQYLSYPIEIIECSPGGKELVHQTNQIRIYAFPLEHRIHTLGFLFEEYFPVKNIIPEVISKYKLTHDDILNIKQGHDVNTPEFGIIHNALLTYPDPDARSYAYCSDTAYNDQIANYVANVSCLYHESTYLHDLVAKACERKHSTALQAATIAKKANAGKLILGHFSTRYTDLQPFLEEARSIFCETYLGTEGAIFPVGN